MRWVSTSPKAIYDYQLELWISANEVWFIMYILSFKWSNSLPYPSISKMVEKSWVWKTTIHRYKDSLINKGYLQIISRKDWSWWLLANAYDFSNLFKKLEELIIRDENLKWKHFENEISEYSLAMDGYSTEFNSISNKVNIQNNNHLPLVPKWNHPQYHNDTTPSSEMILPLVPKWAIKNNMYNNKITTTEKGILLLSEFNISNESKIEIINNYWADRIKEILKIIKKDKDIANKEWFLIDSLKKGYIFNSKEKELEEKKKLKEIEEKKDFEKIRAHKAFEEFKKVQIEAWKNNNISEYENLLNQEIEKVKISWIIKKPKYTAEVNTRVHIWNKYLKME